MRSERTIRCWEAVWIRDGVDLLLGEARLGGQALEQAQEVGLFRGGDEPLDLNQLSLELANVPYQPARESDLLLERFDLLVQLGCLLLKRSDPETMNNKESKNADHQDHQPALTQGSLTDEGADPVEEVPHDASWNLMVRLKL
jgi:hypothetical protein